MFQMVTKLFMSDLTRKMQAVIRPVSKAEINKVKKEVVAYICKQQSGVKSRFRIIEISLSINKPDKRESVPSRLIRAIVADYSNNKNIEFILDSKGRIVRAMDYEGLQPAANDEEIKEALVIARSDERVADLLATKGLFVTSFAPSPDTNNRVIGLTYSLAKKRFGSQSLARVAVDLSERKVTSFEKIGANSISAKGEDEAH